MIAKRVHDRGVVERRHEADELLKLPGDCVLVVREVLRSFVMRCPDGCGDILTINLDPRMAKAWRFYRKRNQISLYPSVWRDSGCGAHFIVWNHTIVWCGPRWNERDAVTEDEPSLRARALRLMTREWLHYTTIAEALEEVPWDVLRACKSLTGKLGPLVQGRDDWEGYFRLAVRNKRNI